MASPDAEAIVEDARRGDGPAREALAARYYGAVYSIARKLTRRDDDAREIAQETFLRAFAAIERQDPSRSFASWLFKIATNLAIDRRRRREPSPPRSAEVPDEAGLVLERSEDLDRVRRALDGLPADVRAALVLHLQEGLPLSDIAFVLEQSEPAVRMKIWRGLQRVRAEVKETP